MPLEALGAAIFAGVAPDTALSVYSAFAQSLGIHLFGVAENGETDAFHAVRVWARQSWRCH
jgi:hypothetical protein